MTIVRGWTGREARALRLASRLSVRAFAERLGVGVRTVSKWEAGGTSTVPRPDTQSILDMALALADPDVQQRFEHLCRSEPTGVVGPADMTLVLSAPAAESVELLRRLQSSDLGSDTLDRLDQTVDQLASAYFTVAPADFRAEVIMWRRYVLNLIEGRSTLRERGRLYAVTGWLTGLLAEASLAMGVDAEIHCATALSLAQEVGDDELAGWVRGAQAQVALYGNDVCAAVAFAEAGVGVAPRGSTALIRSHTYLARANARRARRGAVEQALSAAEGAWGQLTQPLATSIFSLSSSYVPYCATTAFVWLEDSELARSWARQAAEMDGARQPTVGRAIARLDLAIASAQAKDIEESAALGIEALEVCAIRLTTAARRRAEDLVDALAPYQESSVVELRERWRWISA